MKALLINGSPHKNGCTDVALSEVEGVLKRRGVETEMLWIGNKPVAGCIACMSCTKTGKCIRSDDKVNEIIERLDEFDAIIVGSPVYYAGPAGQLTAFLDRLFFAGSNKNFAGKLGAAVVSCRRGGASAAFDRLNKYFTMNNMPVVSSQYWNQIHGFTPDEARQDLEGLQTMRTLGENIAWLLRCIEAGRKAGIKVPLYEPTIYTNFIR